MPIGLLTLGLLPPLRLVVLRAGLDAGVHACPEAQYFPHGGDGFGGVGVGGQVAELLGDAEVDFLRVDVRVVPVDQLAAGGDILCDWLFGEDVLAGAESLFDEVWLDEDGEGDDHGVDVISLEEGGVVFAILGGVVAVEVDGGQVLRD